MLLTEDRISQVKEKYDIPAEVWENMVSGSAAIAKNQKYLEWIARVWRDRVSTPESIETQAREGHIWSGVLNGTLSTIEEFDRLRPNLKNKDLYQYRNRQDVIDALEDYKLERTRNINTHKESEVVFEDDRFKVVVPKSHTASCYYGAGTKWCTASTDNPGHFTNYDKSGKLFYILDKSAPTSDKYYKVAFNKTYKAPGSGTFYDSKDDIIPDTKNIGNIMSHPELMGTINEYFDFTYADEIAKITEEEKQRELERIARDAEWARRRREREQRLEDTARERKENDEWEVGETGTVGIMAHALMVWLIDMGEFNEGNREEIQSKIDERDELRIDMDNDPEVIADPNGERAQDYGQDLNNVDEDIDNLKEEAHDIYDLRYDEYEHYGMPVFEYEGISYAVGTDAMADEAAWEQVDNLLDDVGFEGFQEGFVEYYLDGEMVADDFEDMFQNDMVDNPEDYLDEDNDRELTNEAEQKIDNIDGDIGELQEELEGLENEDEDQEILDQIDELERYKEEITEDDDNWEYTEEAKESYVTDRLQEIRDNPLEFLQEYGYGRETWERYVDRDAFIGGVLESDGRGQGLSSYDGEENEVQDSDEWYYIYRTD